MTLGPGIEPGTHWWEASALTTVPSMLPHAIPVPPLSEWNLFAVITLFQEIDFLKWISCSSIAKIWLIKIAGDQKWLLIVADRHWRVFCHGIHYALFGMHIHLLHILISNTSYQKVNVLCSEKGVMAANIFFFWSRFLWLPAFINRIP